MLRLLPSSAPTATRDRAARHPDELAHVAAAAVAGDRRAVQALLVAIAPHLLRTVRSVLGRDSSDVDDVAQEAALVVLAALPGFRGESSVVRFAMRTAVLVGMNARRKRAASKRGGAARHDSEVDELAAAQPSPEQSVASERAASAVRTLLATLPTAQAEALALHCIAGCTLAEIAEATSAPQETVKSRLRLARQALRQKLERMPGMVEVLEGDT